MPPPSLENEEPLECVLAPEPPLNAWVRGALVGIMLGLLVVFGIAIWLNPYDQEGAPRRIEFMFRTEF